MKKIPPAIKEDNFPTDITPAEVEAGFRNFVIGMPLTHSWPSGTTPETIVAAKSIASGALLVKMRDLMFGGNGYGLFVFGRDPALLDKPFIKPEWTQSWSGLASSLEAAAVHIGRVNMDMAIPIHLDPPPPERIATPEELQ